MALDTKQFRGYCYVWDSGFQGNEYLGRNAIWLHHGISLRQHHLPETKLAHVEDGTLTLWEDDFGIAMAFNLDFDVQGAAATARGICSYKCNGVSIGAMQKARHRKEIVDGVERTIFIHGSIDEVSIVDDGSCWDARCWAADDEHLPPGLRRLNEHWLDGLRAMRSAATPKPDRVAAVVEHVPAAYASPSGDAVRPSITALMRNQMSRLRSSADVLMRGECRIIAHAAFTKWGGA
jgi:hypothetical protein